MNIWSEFSKLIPTTPLLLGTIAADYGNGSYLVNLVGGGTLKGFGHGFAVGNNVYLRGTNIESTAPSMGLFATDV